MDRSHCSFLLKWNLMRLLLLHCYQTQLDPATARLGRMFVHSLQNKTTYSLRSQSFLLDRARWLRMEHRVWPKSLRVRPDFQVQSQE